MRTHLALHGVTADDLRGRYGTEQMYVDGDDVSFTFGGIGGIAVWFRSSADFAAWLAKLNQLAADTPELAAVMAAAATPETMPYYPADELVVAQ